MLKYAFTAAVLFFFAAFANASECTLKLNTQAPITVVGSYSNMSYTEEHAYGYTVELWRSADCLFGFFLSSSGLMGNTPTGQIENINYDEKTSTISFSARLTEGLILSSATLELSFFPSQDVYEFTGVLHEESLRGTLRHIIKNDLPDDQPIDPEIVALPLSHNDSKEMESSLTYSQWELEAKDILKHRGPKW